MLKDRKLHRWEDSLGEGEDLLISPKIRVCYVFGCCFLLILAAPGVSTPSTGAGFGTPTSDISRTFEGLRASQMGVDRAGNLWAHDPRGNTLRILTPSGEWLDSIEIGPASRVDFDREWGAIWLDPTGKRLGFLGAGEGSTIQELELGQDFGDLAWIDSDRVALSPRRAGHRVEIWSLEKGRSVATWGTEEPVRRRPGTVRLRNVLLHPDASTELLYTLETFSGDLEVFDRDGKSTWRTKLPDRDGQKLEEWLRSTDAQNRAEGDTEEVSLHQWPSFTVDSKGQVWVPNRCRRSDPQIQLEMISVPLRGQPEKSTVDLGTSECCSSKATLWTDMWVIYRDSTSPGGGCVETRPLAMNGG